MNLFNIFNFIYRAVSAVVSIFLFGNVLYPVLAVFFSKKNSPGLRKTEFRRYAVLVCARNEENVIGGLINSVKKQDYPQDLIDIFVLADNCSDKTAVVAEKFGAVVFIRNDHSKTGKGYALNYLYEQVNSADKNSYDGFFVFDADNLIPSNYISEMNASFCGRDEVLTSVRNSKNFEDSWVSAGYSLGWLFQTGLLNVGRSVLRIPCFINGTGFLIGTDVLKRTGGWKFFTLTEDGEFTAYCALNDVKIKVCRTAEFYDEQPASFRVSWVQRVRWAKGKYQVFGIYWLQALKGVFSKDILTCADCFFNMFATSLLVLLQGGLTVVKIFVENKNLYTILLLFLLGGVKAYLSMLSLGILTLCLWWKRIKASLGKKILFTFFYPLHVFMYIPIAVVAIFKKIEWVQIKHGVGDLCLRNCKSEEFEDTKVNDLV